MTEVLDFASRLETALGTRTVEAALVIDELEHLHTDSSLRLLEVSSRDEAVELGRELGFSSEWSTSDRAATEAPSP